LEIWFNVRKITTVEDGEDVSLDLALSRDLPGSANFASIVVNEDYECPQIVGSSTRNTLQLDGTRIANPVKQ
jgi:hypothetical protein